MNASTKNIISQIIGVAILLACGIIVSVVLFGCTPPKAVTDAQSMKRAAITSYADNQDKILNAVIDAYRQAEYARIDALMSNDLQLAKAANAGKPIDFDVAVSGMLTQTAKRDDRRAQVELQVAELRKTIARARQDLVSALKIDDLLNQYTNTGIDEGSLIGIIEKVKGIMNNGK